MAPARTRSILLLNDALEHDWLVRPDQTIRVHWMHYVPLGFEFADGEMKSLLMLSNV